MGLYTPVAGQTLTGSFLNNALLNVTPLIAVKAGDTSRSNTASRTADPDLVVALLANLTYTVDSYLMYDAGAGLFQVYWTVPAGATVTGAPWGLDTAVTAATVGGIRVPPTGAAVGSGGSGTVVSARPTANVIMGSTAGNLTLTWAQNTSNATATILKAGSWIRAIQQPV